MDDLKMLSSKQNYQSNLGKLETNNSLKDKTDLLKENPSDTPIKEINDMLDANMHDGIERLLNADVDTDILSGIVKELDKIENNNKCSQQSLDVLNDVDDPISSLEEFKLLQDKYENITKNYNESSEANIITTLPQNVLDDTLNPNIDFEFLIDVVNSEKNRSIKANLVTYGNFDNDTLENIVKEQSTISSINHKFTEQNTSHPSEKQFNINTPTSVAEIVNKEESIEIISISSIDENNSFTRIGESNEGVDKIDTISISSTENSDDDNNNMKDNENSQTIDTDSCNGYHSSDFEFINESEAELDGLIINYKPSNTELTKHNNNTNTTVINVSPQLSKIKTTNEEKTKNSIDFNNEPSTSRFGPTSIDNAKVVNSKREPVKRYSHSSESSDFDVTHKIPEGDDYLKLFQGDHRPILPPQAYFFMESKAFYNTTMNIEYRGIGFDMRQYVHLDGQENIDENTKNEAVETVQKILAIHSVENRKRRRY